MKKVKVETLYLIAIVVGGLIGLATKSTYAIFTSSTEIDNPICMATNLTSEDEVVDTMDVVVASGEVKEIPVTINNTSGGLLNYMVFYNPTLSDIEIGINMKNADSSNSLGVIDTNETKKVYVQIKNNSSSNITITLGVLSNNISSDMNAIPIGKEGESAIIIGNNLVEYITDLYTNAAKTQVSNNSITYNYATSVGLMNDRLGNTSTGVDDGNIRYYGISPNNYIYFNCDDYSNQTDSTCEKWRIIGVFGDKIRIMRNESIGSYSWDNKGNYGENDWSTSRLMKMLNPDFESETGGSLYWNRQSGTCYSGQSSSTKTCDMSNVGLKNDITRNLISKSTIYLKGHDNNNVYSDQAYVSERISGSVYSERPTILDGYVSLVYESDYGYAADLSKCTVNLYSYNSTSCASNNWIFNSTNQWTITPFSLNNYTVVEILSSGEASSSIFIRPDSEYSVRPTISLTSTVNINDIGNGNYSNPYQIAIN